MDAMPRRAGAKKKKRRDNQIPAGEQVVAAGESLPVIVECDGEVRKKLAVIRDRAGASIITYAESNAFRMVLAKDYFTRELEKLRQDCTEEGEIFEGLTDLRDYFSLISLLKETTDSREEVDMIRGLDKQVTRRGAEEEEKLAGAAERNKKAEEAYGEVEEISGGEGAEGGRLQ